MLHHIRLGAQCLGWNYVNVIAWHDRTEDNAMRDVYATVLLAGMMLVWPSLLWYYLVLSAPQCRDSLPHTGSVTFPAQHSGDLDAGSGGFLRTSQNRLEICLSEIMFQDVVSKRYRCLTRIRSLDDQTLMYGSNHYFNNLRFRQSQHLNDYSAAHWHVGI